MREHKWDLTRLSSGEISALKRSAGTMKDSCGVDAIEAFYKSLITSCRPWEEEYWFAALCMQCLWRLEDHPQVKPFEEILRQTYQDSETSDSSKKQCINYMDMPWGKDGFLLGKICHLARKMRAENAALMPDFERLAEDLTHWNRPERSVQRKWMRTIFVNDNQNNEKEKN